MKAISSIIVLLILLAASCTSNQSHHDKISGPVKADTVTEQIDGKIFFHKLNKLLITGDFNGDKIIDTIFQHNYSGLNKAEIDTAPDPFINEWDTVESWFNKQGADVYLASNNHSFDTLHLGLAQGLYCLLNVGDINADGKDDIALAIDYLDLSRVNSRKIYGFSNHAWQLLKEFGIHEAAFDFTGDTIPVFSFIKGFLEKQHGKWVYADYNQDAYDSEEEVGKMKELKIN